MDIPAYCAPAIHGTVAIEFLETFDRPIEGDPCHHLGMGEVQPSAAHFPDAFVRLAPYRLEISEKRLLQIPSGIVHLQVAAARLMERVHYFPEDIELELPMRGVASSPTVQLRIRADAAASARLRGAGK